MKTSIIAFGVALMMMGLGAFGMIQMDELKQHKKILQQKDVEIQELNQLVDDEMEKTAELETTNQILEDSIVELNSMIYTLQQELIKKEERIHYLEGKIKRRNIAIQDLKDQITRLYRKQHLDRDAISKLENEIARLKQERTIAQSHQQDMVVQKQATVAEIKDYQENVNEMQLLTSISERTRVSFTKIMGKKYKNGRQIKKMRKNMNGWQFTDLAFKLHHPDHRILLNQRYLLKIYDLDNEMVLTYLEQNPQFPNTNLNGIGFGFNGNQVELTYCNMQTKQSENYEVRIFLLHNGEEIPLENGVLPIIKNGKFIQL